MALRSRPARALIALASLSLFAAASGDDGDDDHTTATTAAATEGDDAATTTTAAAEDGDEGDGGDAAGTVEEGSATVEVGESDLGTILTSGGRTLYVFVPDDGGPPTCYDDCASVWPPLLADGGVTPGDGVTGELATTPRDDGGEQVTIAGWPLYFFANDAAPGDTNGQGLNGVWFVVAADGTMIE
jgi:predicted lipoprotein with Yx(FWY)xxD motif